jgi:hypothetical protein
MRLAATDKRRTFMRVLRPVLIMLALALSTAAIAEDFDGSKPLQCTANKGHDCLPDKNQCSRLKPEGDKPPVFGIDFANKQVRSPFRTELLTVLYTTINKDSLVLQGADLQNAWSLLINQTTGVMRAAIADRKGAYVVFGQCKVADAAAMSAPPASN